MKKPTPGALARLTLLSGVLLAAPAAFAASSWDLSGNSTSPGCSQSTTNANNYGNSWSCTSTGAPTMTGTAYSTTGTGAAFAAANLAMYAGNGFGVQNSVEGLSAPSPNHSLDNNNSVTDVMLLSFASSVSLSSISLGWSQTDSDISVLRYTGSTPPAVIGATTASLLTSGWQLVGNYANVTPVSSNSSSITGTASINSTGLSSSWWLISAYNSGYGAASDPKSSTTGLDANNDYVKVLTVAGTPTATPPNKVPEPASVPLVGLAFGAMAWVSRRGLKKGAKAA